MMMMMMMMMMIKFSLYLTKYHALTTYGEWRCGSTNYRLGH